MSGDASALCPASRPPAFGPPSEFGLAQLAALGVVALDRRPGRAVP